MAQGFKNKGSGGRPIKKSKGQVAKKIHNKKAYAKKGSSLKMPKKGLHIFEAADDRALSKEIAKASEGKVAAKLLQDGAKLKMNDLVSKGKEINRDKRRDELKKKVSKTDEKIRKLEEKLIK